MRLGRLERPLNALSTHSLCLIGVQTHGKRRRRMEDQAGFEPALGVSHGIKSPVRSAATGTGPKLFVRRSLCPSSLKLRKAPASSMAPPAEALAKAGEPGRSRTSCGGVKSPVPFLWGFTLRVHIPWINSGVAPPRFALEHRHDGYSFLRWRMSFFGKPASTPDQPRAGFFRDMR